MKQVFKPAGKQKSRFTRDAVLASLAMAAVTVASSPAFAAVVCASPGLNVPADINGIYVNLVTGATGTSGTGTAGWDFSSYASTGPLLRFFSSSGSGNLTRYVGAGTTVDLLPSGTMIDATSVLATAGVNQPGAFLAGVTNGYVGIAFNNEATATTNYGWASMTTTGPSGFPATINQYCYQNDGTGIMAGTTPVSLQNYSVE